MSTTRNTSIDFPVSRNSPVHARSGGMEADVGGEAGNHAGLPSPTIQAGSGSMNTGTSPEEAEHFRISSHLKDIIGRDLVTNQFVAVFELVKNAFDAHASRVDVGINLDNGEIWIVDDGKGMDADTIRNRWLFVAYSAKADGTEDGGISTNYRDQINSRRSYAGSKGIGRFSCDTLGESLTLYSRCSDKKPIQQLTVLWKNFEGSSRELFHDIGVQLKDVSIFPEDAPVRTPSSSGTVLRIGNLRGGWNADEFGRLRQYLAKLIDPFGSTGDTPVYLTIIASHIAQDKICGLQGPVGNDIRDLLSEKTTRIFVSIRKSKIETTLTDRGRTIYRIIEEKGYQGLDNSEVTMEIYYLNKSAKYNFTRRMGLQSVKYGSVFLFLNQFRVFPIGEEKDDTFGLNRRKQQGTSRYVGTRDIMGRVDVIAPPKMFREASSRDAGLIDDAHVRDLYEAIRQKGIFRLERYVVGVTWKDKTDKTRDDASGLSTRTMREQAVELIGRLAATSDLQIEYFDPKIVEDLEDDLTSFQRTMKALESIAERQGDGELFRRIKEARKYQAAIERSEREAAEAARQAMTEKVRTDERIARLEQQATYLAKTQDMTAEQMTLLFHQVLIYAGHIGATIDRALRTTREIYSAANDFQPVDKAEDLKDTAAAVSVRTKRVKNDLEYIHLENDRLTAVARFASNARFDLKTDILEGDAVSFLTEYVNQVCASQKSSNSIVFEDYDIVCFVQFRPVDLVVVVDNLWDNARKHRAQSMRMEARRGKKGAVEVVVTDDGLGLDENRVDPGRIFEKGYTSSPRGTGLGLYHARKVMEDMGGGLQLDPRREAGRATFVLTLPEEL